MRAEIEALMREMQGAARFGDVGRESVTDWATRLTAFAQGVGEGWQPIETAPRDGRLLLLCRAGGTRAYSGYWLDAGAYAAGGSWRDYDTAAYRDPTHWQPMPKPAAALTPQQDTGGEG